MTVIVSSLGPTLDDRVDDRFGRATYLLVVDEEGALVETIDNNANRNALQGAGIGTAEIVSSRDVSAVLTGHLGPKAFDALKTAGVEGYSASGLTVREAVKAYMQGTLESLDSAGPAHGGL